MKMDTVGRKKPVCESSSSSQCLEWRSWQGRPKGTKEEGQARGVGERGRSLSNKVQPVQTPKRKHQSVLETKMASSLYLYALPKLLPFKNSRNPNSPWKCSPTLLSDRLSGTLDSWPGAVTCSTPEMQPVWSLGLCKCQPVIQSKHYPALNQMKAKPSEWVLSAHLCKWPLATSQRF